MSYFNLLRMLARKNRNIKIVIWKHLSVKHLEKSAATKLADQYKNVTQE